MKGLVQIINSDSNMTDQLLIRCSTHKPNLWYNVAQWTWFYQVPKSCDSEYSVACRLHIIQSMKSDSWKFSNLAEATNQFNITRTMCHFLKDNCLYTEPW